MWWSLSSSHCTPLRSLSSACHYAHPHLLKSQLEMCIYRGNLHSTWKIYLGKSSFSHPLSWLQNQASRLHGSKTSATGGRQLKAGYFLHINTVNILTKVKIQTWVCQCDGMGWLHAVIVFKSQSHSHTHTHTLYNRSRAGINRRIQRCEGQVHETVLDFQLKQEQHVLTGLWWLEGNRANTSVREDSQLQIEQMKK